MAVGLWGKTNGMAHKTDVSSWNSAPATPNKFNGTVADKDAIIQQFLSEANNNQPENLALCAKFVSAVSAVIDNEFKDRLPDDRRDELIDNLRKATPTAGTRWEAYREQAVNFLLESKGLTPSSDINPDKVAIVYQLENGLLRDPADEKIRADELLDHIKTRLDPNVGPAMSPERFADCLIYLYRRGSSKVYNQVMTAFKPIRNRGNGKIDPALLDEWELFNSFPEDRKLSTRAFHIKMDLLDKAVEKFYSPKTSSSISSVPALIPGAQPPVAPVAAPIVNVSPIAIPNANPSVVPVAAQLTPKQKTIKDEMNRLKNDVDLHEMELSLFENNIAKYQKELAALAGQPLEKAEQFKQNVSAEKEFKWDTHYLVVMKAHVDENAQIQASASPPVFDQASALQQIYNKAIDTFEDGKTGIKARAAKANADLVKLKTQTIGAVNAAVASLIKSFLSQMEALRDDAKNEKIDAKTLRDQASVEYKTITGTDLKYHTKDQLLIEQKRMNRFKSGIKLKSSRVSSDGNIATKYYAKISDLSTTHPTAYMSSGGTVSLASADALEKEIASFKTEVDQYAQDVDNWIADVFSATKTHLAIEDAKIPFKASPPDPKKYGEDRINQCNVWFHMFDADRLTRSDRYRLAQLEAHPNQPWAINFASDLDTIRVLEAAVKSGRSNKMMDLKDMPNFYKMVENLIIATCEGLKMAPPQPNSMDEKMLLFVATGASLHEGVQWAYSNDGIKAWEFTRLNQVVQAQVDPVNKKIRLPDGTDANLLTQSRHLAQSAKAPKFVRIEEAY